MLVSVVGYDLNLSKKNGKNQNGKIWEKIRGKAKRKKKKLEKSSLKMSMCPPSTEAANSLCPASKNPTV